jgi:large subunit ribosomal protein L15
MPLQRRLPKRGFHNIFKKRNVILNIKDLARFEQGSVVDMQAIITAGLTKGTSPGIKLLGEGTISHSLTVKVHACSKTAREKIEAAGGKVETINI